VVGKEEAGVVERGGRDAGEMERDGTSKNSEELLAYFLEDKNLFTIRPAVFGMRGDETLEQRNTRQPRPKRPVLDNFYKTRDRRQHPHLQFTHQLLHASMPERPFE